MQTGSLASRTCSVLLALSLASGGVAVAGAGAAYADDAAASPSLELQSVVLKANTSYTANVELLSTSDKKPSIIAEMLGPVARVNVDSTGTAYLSLDFSPREIFSQMAHVRDLKVYSEGSTTEFDPRSSFVLSDKNEGIAQVALPYTANDGYYLSKIFSDKMDRDVIVHVKWDSLHEEGPAFAALKSAVAKATALSESDYTPESYRPLKDALDIANTLIGLNDTEGPNIVSALLGIERARHTLVQANPEITFKAGTKYYVDVKDQDSAGKHAINSEAVFDVDADGVIKVTLKYNPYSDFLGPYVVDSAVFLKRDGSAADNQKLVKTDEGGAVWTFDLPYISNSGLYKALVTAAGSEEKEHVIEFDWSTVRTTADFRKLEAAIAKASELNPADYTTASFNVLAAVLERAKQVAADKTSSQATIDAILGELQSAFDSLYIVENNGVGKTANLGLSGFNAPFKNEEGANKAWAGSRVYLGKGTTLWRVLDKDSGLLLSENVLTEDDTTDSAHAGVDFATEFIATWENSKVRTYLNSTYFNDLLSDAEKSIVSTSTVEMHSIALNGDVTVSGSTQDKVFLLNLADYKKPEYGFNSDASRAAPLSVFTTSQFMNMPVTVSYLGFTEYMGSPIAMPATSTYIGADPALRIDAGKVLLTTPAASTPPTSIVAPEYTVDNIWKLTLLDESAQVAVKAVRTVGKGVSVDYTASAPEGAQMSALVVRDGDYKTGTLVGYGTAASAAAAAGTATFALPADYNKATDKIYLFSEVIGKGNASNVASTPVEVDLSAATEDQAWERLAGDDALGTMAAIAAEGWADGSCQNVVVASADGYWDALTASSLAGAYNCPVLLTNGSKLSDATAAQIKRLGAQNVYICGGEFSVSAEVKTAIEALGAKVVRLSGENAAGTAVAVAKQTRTLAASDTCVIATASSFYDALSVSPWSYASKMPIYLATGDDNVLDEATLADIKARGYTKAIIAGGVYSVSETAAASLTSQGGIPADNVTRLSGQNAWMTSAALAQAQIKAGDATPSTFGIADGNGYWDALSGAALCGKNGAALLLVPHDGDGFSYDPYCIDTVLKANAGKVVKGYVFGGVYSVPQSTMDAAIEAVK